MAKFKVFVTRKLPGEGLKKLYTIADIEINSEDRVLTKKELVDRVRGKEGIVTMLTDNIDTQVLDSGTNLKVISNYAAGFDNINLEAATQRGIYVTNTPEVLTETVADLAWALILGIARRLVEADHFTRSGCWKGWEPSLLLGNDVFHKTLGIIGLGRIGSAVAQRARGFNMKILYYNRTRHESLEKKLKLTYVSLETLLKEADYITIHVPLTPLTYHLIGEKELELIRPTTYLINTSRGSVIDEQALYKSLKNHTIAGAGLDVFETEPVNQNNPLMKLGNTLLLPHVGSGTIETRITMADLAIENLMCVLQGTMPQNLVNSNVVQIRPLN